MEKYPLIILGAGASYDYAYNLTGDIRISPLTNQLVGDHYFNNNILGKYRDIGYLISGIKRNVLDLKTGLEKELSRKLDNYGNKIDVVNQFIDLEFSLREIFESVSNKYKEFRANNYKALIDNIKILNDGFACVVTFNYDSLFEKNFDWWKIDQKKFRDMDKYINGDLKFIKLHGSHDWAYAVPDNSLKNYSNDYNFYKNNPQLLNSFRRERIEPRHVEDIFREERLRKTILTKFPAIAIPISNKDLFLCPQNHINELEIALEKIDRILIIGWKAEDPWLLNLIKEKLQNVDKKIKTFVVSRDELSANQIIEKLKFIPNLKCKPIGGGFSGLIHDKFIEEFFN